MTTITAYCRHKNLPLSSVSTTYDFSRIHAKDCEDCDIPDKGFIEKITSNVHIEGDFDEGTAETTGPDRCEVPGPTKLWHTVSRLKTTLLLAEGGSHD